MKILHHVLEEEVTLSVRLRTFLSQVTGPNFYSLYRLVGDHCRQLDHWLGEITDRTRAFGSRTNGPVSPPVPAATDEATSRPPRSMLDELLARHEGIAQRVRRDLAACGGDRATTDFLTRLVEFHEDTAWMLRMIIERPEVPDELT